MDFLNWWFDTHYILSTLFTIKLAFLWAIWKGEALRAVVTALLMIVAGVLHVVGEKK